MLSYVSPTVENEGLLGPRHARSFWAAYWPGFLWLLGQEPPDLLRLWQATVSVKRLLWEVVAGRQGLFPAFPESRGSPRRRVMAVEGIKLF